MRQKGGGTCESSTQLVCNDNEGLWVRIEIHWTPWLIIRRQQQLLRRHDDHQKCNPTLLSRVPFSLKPELPMLLHYCHVLSSEVRLFFFHKRCQCPSMMPLKSAGDLNGNLSLKPELSHHLPTTISVKSSDAVKLVLCAALLEEKSCNLTLSIHARVNATHVKQVLYFCVIEELQKTLAEFFSMHLLYLCF